MEKDGEDGEGWRGWCSLDTWYVTEVEVARIVGTRYVIPILPALTQETHYRLSCI